MPPLSIGIIARDQIVGKAIGGQLQHALVEDTYLLGPPCIIDAAPGKAAVVQRSGEAIRANGWDLVLLEANLATPAGDPSFDERFFSGFPQQAFGLFYDTTNQAQMQELLALPNVIGEFVKPRLDVPKIMASTLQFFGGMRTVEVAIERQYGTQPYVSDPNPSKLGEQPGDGTDEGTRASTVPGFDSKPNTTGSNAVRQVLNAETNLRLNTPSAKNVADRVPQQRTATMFDPNLQEGSLEDESDRMGEENGE